MAKLIVFGKEHLLYIVGTFLLLALFGVLLLIDFAIYLKLGSVFLFILLIVGWFLESFYKQEQRSQLLTEGQKHSKEKCKRLSELEMEFSRIPFVRDKLPEIQPKLVPFLGEYFKSDKFLLFVKKRNEYQLFLTHNVTLPRRGRITIRSNSEFVSLLKSTEELKDLEFIQSVKVPSSFRALHKQYQFNRLIPLLTASDLQGFVVLKAGDKSPAENLQNAEYIWEEKLPFLVLNQIAHNLEKENLSSELREIESKLNTCAKKDRTELSVLNRDIKRKIFDLNAVLGLVKELYSVTDEEALFSSLAQMMQDHLGAKSVFLMLPGEKDGDIVGRFFSGAHTSDLFGKESISELRIERRKALYNWIKNEKQIWRLFSMQRISREEKLLMALLDSGFQIGAKLSFDRDNFGIIFLGEKNDGVKYRQIDLDILTILIDTGVITFRNILRFKSIEELSYTDSITELYNYRYFYKRLTEETFRAKRFNRKLALVIFDIDDFKIYNDTYGHQAGDQLLKQLGQLLSRTVRSIDVVSRYGGEEFCVIMPESDQEECLQFMERLRKNIMNFPFKDEYLKQEHNITVSLGGAVYPYDARSVDRLIYSADMALLKAKSKGKNMSVIYEEKLVPVGQ